VFRRVIDKLDLTNDPEVKPRPGETPESAALRLLSERVKASRDEKSFVVTLAATTGDPGKSVRIAGAVIDAFREELAQSDAEGASRAADSLTGRLGTLKDAVTKAEAAVDDFRRAHNLQMSQGELTSTQTMTQVNSQLLQAQAKLIDLKARYDKLTAGGDDGLSAAAQESTTLTALRTQYATTRQQAESLKATLGPLHPSVRSILVQVASLQAQIRTETARIVQAAKSDVDQAQAAVDQLQTVADDSKSIVAVDSSAQVTLNDLQREASSRAAIYEASLDRARQIAEREQIDTTNIRVITDPVAPISRSWPPPLLQLLALGAAAGFA
jgi:uncharacterized protein involved in exopolysaccharide biosynthesis